MLSRVTRTRSPEDLYRSSLNLEPGSVTFLVQLAATFHYRRFNFIAIPANCSIYGSDGIFSSDRFAFGVVPAMAISRILEVEALMPIMATL